MKNRPEWWCCLYEAFWVLPSSLRVIFSIVYIHIFYLEKEMATYSSILAWKSPWTEEPGGLQSMGLNDWACVHEGGGRWVGSNKVVELKKKKYIYFSIVYMLWSPDMKNWLTGKEPDAGKDWRLKKKGMTEDEMVGWHYRLNRHELAQIPGVADRQGSLACCSLWGCKESDMTQRLNWYILKDFGWQRTEIQDSDHHAVLQVGCGRGEWE